MLETLFVKGVSTCFPNSFPVQVTFGKNKAFACQIFKDLLHHTIFVHKFVLREKYFLHHIRVKDYQRWPCHESCTPYFEFSWVEDPIFGEFFSCKLLKRGAIVFQQARFMIGMDAQEGFETSNQGSIVVRVHNHSLALVVVKLLSDLEDEKVQAKSSYKCKYNNKRS